MVSNKLWQCICITFRATDFPFKKFMQIPCQFYLKITFQVKVNSVSNDKFSVS